MIHLPIVVQKTDSHCGPAVMQLLLSHLHRNVSQDQVVQAAGISESIIEQGARPAQLAAAVKEISSDLQFWFKQAATVDDLQFLVEYYHWPVAVNWQGLFYDTDEEQEAENPGADHGHYSVVVGVDPGQDQIIIADTYAEYSAKPRVFSLEWFKTRWWDVATDNDPTTGEEQKIRTQNFMFIAAPKNAEFPRTIRMLPPEYLNILKI